MASKMDEYHRKNGNDENQMTHNHGVASSQSLKTGARAHKVALGADKYNPQRLSNAIQQRLTDN